MPPPTFPLVIPVHDEQETLPLLYPEPGRSFDGLDGTAEAVFVDDGSPDRSDALLSDLHGVDPRSRAVRLTRTSGPRTAITAGLDAARGAAVATTGADLRDRPAVVLEMAVRRGESGDVGSQADRSDDTRRKPTTAHAFYRLVGRPSSTESPGEVGDFPLTDRALVDALTGGREPNLNARGMVPWRGYRQLGAPYERPARRTGQTSRTVAPAVRPAGPVRHRAA